MLKYLSFRDLRNTPGSLWRALKSAATVTLTANGVPKALVIGIEGDDLEAALAAVNRARAQLLLSKLRARAQETLADRLGAEAIEAEVRAVRRSRRR